MKIAVYCSSSDNLDPLYYQQAEELGKWIGSCNHTLVYGGASCGLMEAVAKGSAMSHGTVQMPLQPSTYFAVGT